MIVSHKYRFIFIKTRKTAGSSIEAALSPHLGSYDIITGSDRDGVERRNCPTNLTGHLSFRVIEELIGSNTFWSYYKFCFERNSYDKAVSSWLYHRDIIQTIRPDTQFEEYIKHFRLSDWTRYTFHNRPIAEIFAFENLEESFYTVCRRVKLPLIDIADYKYKVNTSRRSYEHYYNQESKKAVETVFSAEIKHFGYKFGG